MTEDDLSVFRVRIWTQHGKLKGVRLLRFFDMSLRCRDIVRPPSPAVARRRPPLPAVTLTRPNLINMSILNPEFTYPNLPGTPHFLGTPKGSRLQNLG